MTRAATFEKLRQLKLEGMGAAYERQVSNPAIAELCFDERLAMLVDAEHDHQRNRAVERRLKNAKLRQNAAIEQFDWRQARNVKRDALAELATCEWLRRGQHCVITGPTGVGKSWLACALAQKACRDGYSVLYSYSPRLFRDLLAGHADGSLTRLYKRLSRFDLLLIDDWGLEVVKRTQYRDFLELIDERQGKSMLMTSQYPVSSWHENIGDNTIADAIVDRLIHHSHQINMEGESMR